MFDTDYYSQSAAYLSSLSRICKYVGNKTTNLGSYLHGTHIYMLVLASFPGHVGEARKWPENQATSGKSGEFVLMFMWRN